MKDGSRYLFGSLACFASLAFSAIGVEAKADVMRPTITYSTSMEIGQDGRDRALPGVSFQGVENRTVQAAAPFPNGEFPSSPPAGSMADFDLGKWMINLPSEGIQAGMDWFALTVRVSAIDGVELDQPLVTTMKGLFSGALLAEGSSNLGVAMIETPPLPFQPPLPPGGRFTNGELDYNILLPDYAQYGSAALAGGEIALSAQLATMVNTPEPSTWAIFSMAAAGAWWSRKRRAR